MELKKRSGVAHERVVLEAGLWCKLLSFQLASDLEPYVCAQLTQLALVELIDLSGCNIHEVT
jgi:hypothetical protein